MNKTELKAIWIFLTSGRAVTAVAGILQSQLQLLCIYRSDTLLLLEVWYRMDHLVTSAV